jgi:hypothetical protein
VTETALPRYQLFGEDVSITRLALARGGGAVEDGVTLTGDVAGGLVKGGAIRKEDVVEIEGALIRVQVGGGGGSGGGGGCFGLMLMGAELEEPQGEEAAAVAGGAAF